MKCLSSDRNPRADFSRLGLVADATITWDLNHPKYAGTIEHLLLKYSNLHSRPIPITITITHPYNFPSSSGKLLIKSLILSIGANISPTTFSKYGLFGALG